MENCAFFFICPGQLLKGSSAQGRSLACRRLQKASGRCNLGNWGSSGLVEGLSFLRGRRERPPPGVSRVGMGLCAIGGERGMQTDFRSSRQHQPHIPSGWYGVCTCTSPHSFLPSFSPRVTLLVATIARGNRDGAGSRGHGAMYALVRGQQKGVTGQNSASSPSLHHLGDMESEVAWPGRTREGENPHPLPPGQSLFFSTGAMLGRPL